MRKISAFELDESGKKIKKYNGISSFVIIPPNITEIDLLAFFDNRLLEYIYIPKTVEKIGALCFPNIDKLYIFCEQEKEPESWDKKWRSEFVGVKWNCRKNKDFIYNLENGYINLLKYIGNRKTLIIPEKIDGAPVKRVCSYTFRTDCPEIIEFPDSLEELEDDSFFKTFCRYIFVPEATKKYSINAFGDLPFNESSFCGCCLCTQMEREAFRKLVNKEDSFMDYVKQFIPVDISTLPSFYLRGYTDHYFVPIEQYVGYSDTFLIIYRKKYHLFTSVNIFGKEDDYLFYHSSVEKPEFESLEKIRRLELGDESLRLLFCYRSRNSKIGVVCFANNKQYRFDRDEPLGLIYTLFGHY